MTASIYDSEDWRLRAFLQWVPNKQLIPCPTCRGNGKYTAGWGDMDDDGRDRLCVTCNGRCHIMHPPEGSKPEIPKELLDYMKDAWERYNFMRNPEPVASTPKPS